MRYKKPKSQAISLAVPPASGAYITTASTGIGGSAAFYSWLPSTWPAAPAKFDRSFIGTLKHIFEESVLGEIENVIEGIRKSNGDLEHRGHVVGISLMCALDAVSSYPYREKNVAKFVAAHFPAAYKPHADALYVLYRNSMIHSWNLFEASILPGSESITKSKGGTLSFGLLNFFQGLEDGVSDFLQKLETDSSLQLNTLNRYSELRKTAKA